MHAGAVSELGVALNGVIVGLAVGVGGTRPLGGGPIVTGVGLAWMMLCTVTLLLCDFNPGTCANKMCGSVRVYVCMHFNVRECTHAVDPGTCADRKGAFQNVFECEHDVGMRTHAF
eukprot:1156603-Pelagomonas_calceolata.AAC.3